VLLFSQGLNGKLIFVETLSQTQIVSEHGLRLMDFRWLRAGVIYGIIADPAKRNFTVCEAIL
jgi:hypothetical protein